MELYLISLDYPFFEGETFIEDELAMAKDYFDRINIVSLSGHVNFDDMRKIPDNADLIVARRKRYEIKPILISFLKMLSFESICELLFAKKRLKTNLKDICLQIFIYQYYCVLLRRAFENMNIKGDDIVYSYWLAAPAFFLSKSKNIICKKISRTHRFDCFIDYSYQPFRRQILENIDAVYSISQAGKDDIEKNLINRFNFHVDKKVLRVSRLGIFKNSEKMNPAEITSDYLEIVTCSNINRVKRLDLLIEALSFLDIKVHWTHIGSGELEENIKRLATALDNKSNIKYTFLGRKRKDEILKYYEENHIDLFVNCSDSEGIPVSIMEAMSYGIPVIARNVGGNNEIINVENGFLLKQDENSYNISNAIMEFVNMSQIHVSNMRDSAYYTFKDRYDAKKNYSRFFKQIIAERK